MPHGERVRGIKRNLALPGESNRRNIQGGVGQVQDQASPIVSEKPWNSRWLSREV